MLLGIRHTQKTMIINQKYLLAVSALFDRWRLLLFSHSISPSLFLYLPQTIATLVFFIDDAISHPASTPRSANCRLRRRLARPTQDLNVVSFTPNFAESRV